MVCQGIVSGNASLPCLGSLLISRMVPHPQLHKFFRMLRLVEGASFELCSCAKTMFERDDGAQSHSRRLPNLYLYEDLESSPLM